MKSPIDALERKLIEWKPAARRRYAVHILVWSLAAGLVNVVLYIVGVIKVDHLILITLILSWLAIAVTAADLVATTDVRKEEDGD